MIILTTLILTPSTRKKDDLALFGQANPRYRIIEYLTVNKAAGTTVPLVSDGLFTGLSIG
jgi:hypothetical protein